MALERGFKGFAARRVLCCSVGTVKNVCICASLSEVPNCQSYMRGGGYFSSNHDGKELAFALLQLIWLGAGAVCATTHGEVGGFPLPPLLFFSFSFFW